MAEKEIITVVDKNEVVTVVDKRRAVAVVDKAKTDEGEVTPFSPQMPLHYSLLAFLWDSVSILASLLTINYLDSLMISATANIPILPMPIVFASIVVVWLIVFGMRSSYKMRKETYRWSELSNVIKSTVISSLTVMSILYLVGWEVSRIFLFEQALIALVFIVSWRSIYHTFAYFNFVGGYQFKRRILVIIPNMR